MTARGLIIAAPASGSGKTLISLGLMAAFNKRGVAVAAAKVGPDYIDPAFHRAALGAWGSNLDGWAMPPDVLASRVARLSQRADLVVCEGVMGLLDGADIAQGPDGSTAQIAAITGWPVVLVVDAARMAGSAAAIVAGFAGIDAAVKVAGVIFNRVGTERHRSMILRGMQMYCSHVPVLGFLPHVAALAVPSRHLGLVQAAEHPDILAFVASAAQMVELHLDLDRVLSVACPAKLGGGDTVALKPLGQRIAVARDVAFAFAYADLLAEWQAQGAEILPFSPLADQSPPDHCDAVYVPGGYPELALGQLAGNAGFKAGMHRAASRQVPVYGECGGYMTLGQAVIDERGVSHAMLGLLPIVTSMERPKRHLGYRRVTLKTATSWGRSGQSFRGHEFHYAVEIERQGGELFHQTNANGLDGGGVGCCQANVSGSFVHLLSSEGLP